MTTNRTRAEQIVMAMVSKNPPLWVDLIEQALDEAVEKALYDRMVRDMPIDEELRLRHIKEGTLAGLDMAAGIARENSEINEDMADSACDCHEKIRAKAKELENSK